MPMKSIKSPAMISFHGRSVSGWGAVVRDHRGQLAVEAQDVTQARDRPRPGVLHQVGAEVHVGKQRGSWAAFARVTGIEWGTTMGTYAAN